MEGYISGIHKSPFHGFSAEFAEHKIYNSGESTRHIDWKLFARTDKLYTRRYEEETNLRCHLILDNSASMHYPKLKSQQLGNLNKIGFSVLASACLMQILKRQRDAVGLSVYSNEFEYYAPERGGERHHQMLISKMNDILKAGGSGKIPTPIRIFIRSQRNSSVDHSYSCLLICSRQMQKNQNFLKPYGI